ncbi:MAG: serine/threonine dehydratase [Paracoccaceae bacterium]
MERSEIEASLARIAPHVHRTPVLTTAALWDAPVEVKLENTQLTGSFKVRGAFETLLTADVPAAGIVAASGGNHGAAVAHAARALGHHATVFVPQIAGPAKIALIHDAGAELTVVPGAYADAALAAAEHQARTGAMSVHPYDAPATIRGQATLMAEWEGQGLAADTVLIAVGGGGLIAGALSWMGAARKVVTVEPERAPTLHAALAAGAPVDVEVSGIAANALGARRIGARCLELASGLDVTSVLVPDAAIAEAQSRLWSALRQHVEPAGAAALAALACGAYVPRMGERVAILVCGANPAPAPDFAPR